MVDRWIVSVDNHVYGSVQAMTREQAHEEAIKTFGKRFFVVENMASLFVQG